MFGVFFWLVLEFWVFGVIRGILLDVFLFLGFFGGVWFLGRFLEARGLIWEFYLVFCGGFGKLYFNKEFDGFVFGFWERVFNFLDYIWVYLIRWLVRMGVYFVRKIIRGFRVWDFELSDIRLVFWFLGRGGGWRVRLVIWLVI